MHILFITGNYPTPARPTSGTFVKQFVTAIAREVNRCSVIHPVSFFDRRFGPYPLEFDIEQAGNHKFIEVHRPRYSSFSSKNLGLTHTGRWTQKAFNAASLRVAQALETPPDLVYGHFLYHAGRAATLVGQAFGIPSVIRVGEGSFWTLKPFGFKRAMEDIAPTTAFLANGTHIKRALISQLKIPPENIRVQTNGVDLTRFHPGDKIAARTQLGLSLDSFLIVFIGTFDELKGGDELILAVQGMDDIALAMIGQGDRKFFSNGLIHQGKIPHDKIPTWLNASDLFVLPTREEGSCNAVIEAIACGVPVITSNGDYMDDIVDDQVAIRVDPTDVQSIRRAIDVIKNDPLRRRRMIKAAIEKREYYDIGRHARQIVEWMDQLVSETNKGPKPGGSL